MQKYPFENPRIRSEASKTESISLCQRVKYLTPVTHHEISLKSSLAYFDWNDVFLCDLWAFIWIVDDKKSRMPAKKNTHLFAQSIWKTFYLWITHNWVDKMYTVLDIVSHMVASTRIVCVVRQRHASCQQIPTLSSLFCWSFAHRFFFYFSVLLLSFLCHELTLQTISDKRVLWSILNDLSE